MADGIVQAARRPRQEGCPRRRRRTGWRGTGRAWSRGPWRTPPWRLAVGQLRDPLILVLLAAVVLTVATGDLADASVIVLVIVVNTTVGVVQEVKAGQAIAALSDLTAPEARVLRDPGQRQIPAAEVVTGDMLVLAEG